ncbi:hypothetical protein ORG27_14840 [Stenotrophomonas lactitubi]|uniref:hypothetical protein n=1 Tax=Stenotrophomonas lactitubi TaxID=2045214 RepID=UPI002248D72B|nr:hypothetical protein [Stenotrophomonas lactitubi]MCX2894854.1 hypothetical protein [Stenotrophomonas lactitubi]
MEIGSIISAFSAVATLKDAAQAALAVRDFNAAGAAISKITDELLKAQQNLLVQFDFTAKLQAELEQKRRELSELQKALEDRARYTLVELTDGIFVYRLKDSPAGDDGVPDAVEPVHHLCQTCYDKGVKSVLQRSNRVGDVTLDCRVCSAQYRTGKFIPYEAINFKPGQFT